MKHKDDITIPKTIGTLQTQFTGEEFVITKGTQIKNNTYFKFKLCYNHETVLIYFFLTYCDDIVKPKHTRITENLVKEVNLKLNDRLHSSYKMDDLLYNSKLLNIPGVYCLPFVPSKDFDNLQTNINESINMTYIDNILEFHIKLDEKINEYSHESDQEIFIHIFSLNKNKLHFWDGRGELVHAH